jgi:hypothetical protein
MPWVEALGGEMSAPIERLYAGGQPNPDMAGIPIRGPVSGRDPATDRISEAARVLRCAVQFVDADGFEQEIIAASPVRNDGALAYVSTSAKDVGQGGIDVAIRFHVRDAQSREVSSTIESYNPYFGCDVRFLEWMDNSALLIYREKHRTYVAVSDSTAVPRYVQIADAWVIKDGVLGYWNYRATEVQRLKVPSLEPLDAISEVTAIASGLCPRKHW